MKHLFHCIIWVVTLALMVCGCEPKPAITPSGKTIKIGIIAPLSGSDFAKGKEGLKGAQTAVKMCPLLDNGDRIEILSKDDKNDPAEAVEALKELVQSDQVAAVVTFSSSNPVLAMAKVANTYRTPILAALATHPEVTRGNDYVSQICFDNNFQGKVSALFVRDDLLIDRVAIFRTPGSVYSINLATEFEKKFLSLGGVVTDVIELTEKNKTLADILNGVRKKDPELLYLPVGAEAIIAILQQVEQMGWSPRLMASDGILATVFSQYKGHLKLLDGLLATDFFHHTSRGTGFGKRARSTKVEQPAIPPWALKEWQSCSMR